MHKNKFILSFVFLVLGSNLLLITRVLAHEAVTPVYGWEPSNEYIYNSIGSKQNFIKLNITVIENDNGKFLLAFESESMPDFILFASMDKHGIASKLTISSEALNQSEENTATLRVYFQKFVSVSYIWQLPPVPLQNKQAVEFQHSLYRLDGYSNDERNVINIKGASPNPLRNEGCIISFDLKRGIITDYKATGENPYTIIKLIAVNPVSKDIISNLKIKYRDSVCEDDFRLMVFIPELHKDNFRDKRSAFGALCQIKDETKLKELFHTEFLTEAVNNPDPRFCQIVDNYLFTLAMSGKKWAFNELVNPERNAILKETYSKSVIPLDGFDRFDDRHQLGKDTEKWKEWYARLIKVLPSLQDTETEALVAATQSDDPWVRLFALETLLQRLSLPASTTFRVLKSMSEDKDTKVNCLVRKQMEMFDKLTKELPSLEDAETEKLEAATRSDDPDVRLFALETLLHRSSVSESTILRVLEKLSMDQDTLISGRASMLLEEMKMKKQRAFLRHKQSN